MISNTRPLKSLYSASSCRLPLINRQLALKDIDFDSFLLLVLRRIAFLAHGLAAHFDAMSVVNQTVEDAVSDGGIANLLVPARDRQLGSKNGGASLVAIFTDLPDFATLVFIQRGHGPVINDQNIDPAQSSQEVAQASIGPCQGQFTQHGGSPQIKCRVAVATGFLRPFPSFVANLSLLTYSANLAK